MIEDEEDENNLPVESIRKINTKASSTLRKQDSMRNPSLPQAHETGTSNMLSP